MLTIDERTGMPTLELERPVAYDAKDLDFDPMRFVVPEYERKVVNEAGRTYMNTGSSKEDREQALVVIHNWRAAHGFPLNTFRASLRSQASHNYPDALLAQRIKRLPSIRHKLDRMPTLPLATMQDIGGCRAILSSVEDVERLVRYYTEESQIRHKRLKRDHYILEPKTSGYRGVHLIYAYNSDKNTQYNDLRIELQIRTQLQHAWATAVETVGTFTQQALKSSQGAKNWLRFFALMSSALALREGTPPVPGTPTDPEQLVRDLRKSATALRVADHLRAYGATLQHIEQDPNAKPGSMFVLQLDAPANQLAIWSHDNEREATEHYDDVERSIEGQEGKDAVLVRVESLSTLRRAYPNYFLDTSKFVDSLEEAVAS
jgi:ppGpp synthetase/RelA/SpoT-type nucleotidyltranferase